MRNGVTVASSSGSNGGSLTVRACAFSDGLGGNSIGIDVSGYRYVSLLQNRMYNPGGVHILVSSAEELTVASNSGKAIFAGNIDFNGVRQVSFIHNSFDGLDNIYFDDIGSVTNQGTSFIEVTPSILSAKQIVFPANFLLDGMGVPAVAINLVTGSSYQYGTDFTVSGDTISWAGLGMDIDLYTEEQGAVVEGDIIRIIYEVVGGSGGGSGVYWVDSNNMTNVGAVQFSSGLFASVVYNNFYNSTIVIPLHYTNITADPLYVNSGVGNLALTSGSPCVNAANPSMGYLPGNLNTVAIYQRLQDIYSAHLVYMQTVPDIGAAEFLDNVVVPGSDKVLGHGGYDRIFPGSPSYPFKRLGYTSSVSGTDDVSVKMTGSTDKVSTRRVYADESVISGLPASPNSISIDNPRPAGPVSLTDYFAIQPFDPVDLNTGVTLTRIFVSEDGDDDAGNGSEASPYRTLGKAISIPGIAVIYVIAGSYPWFTGSADKSVVFLPKKFQEYMGSFRITGFGNSSWTVTENTDVTVQIDDNTLDISHS
jgi:hypothetical protein